MSSNSSSTRATGAPKLLVVTPGDPDGIGPEIVWKAIRAGRYAERGVHLLCIGARKPFDQIRAPVAEATEESIARGELPPSSLGPVVWLLPAPTSKPKKAIKGFCLEGFQAGWAIEKAVALVRANPASALVTGPISKERLNRGGYPYPGHTEFLAKLCKTPHVTMMLANDRLRVSLVTTHLALKDVPAAIRRDRVRRTIEHTAAHLRERLKIAEPRIAVAALNPHAGEGGLFGKEEQRVIVPELQALKKSARGKYHLSGPHPADTLFAKHVAAAPGARYDAVVCMYHDQGLIPVKLLDFPRTVNVTLGLPIVRTSVDHGVSFDIAHTGKADPSSLQSAIEMALQFSDERTSHVSAKASDQSLHLS